MIGYKVVARVGRRNRSAVVNDGIEVRFYVVGEWTEPFCEAGPLAVFNNLACARHFKIGMEAPPCMEDDFRVYECEYKPSQEKRLRFTYQMPGGLGGGKPLYRTPSGTRFADAVKLLEEVA